MDLVKLGHLWMMKLYYDGHVWVLGGNVIITGTDRQLERTDSDGHE